MPRFAAELTEERADGVTDMLSYALSEEDMFIIHDLTLSGDRNLFPDTSEGQPHNVSFWGRLGAALGLQHRAVRQSWN